MPTLDFKGKQHIYAHHLAVQYRPLIPDADKSVKRRANGGAVADAPPDDNLIIHGDNLHALKALLPRYANRVKCIYIDPPYNTGNEGWVYNDRVNSPLMRQWLKDNGAVDGEDMERHDKWLCMMWPRLQLLRELLADDGVIFVSIDDNEQHHLRMLMDEVFGDSNFITCISVVSNLAGSSDQFGFAGAHEYCLAYAKIRGEVSLNRFPVSSDALDQWQQDEIGYYRAEQLRRGSLTYSESLHYPIFVSPDMGIEVTDNDEAPTTGNGAFTAVLPVMSNGQKGTWRWSKNRVRDNPGDVFAEKRNDGSIMIYSKQRPQIGDMPTEKPKTVFYKPEYGSRAGGNTLRQLLNESENQFPYPKALGLIADILRIGADKDSIILDSFAGSGTTAHAVLALNNEDGGNRKFILVECEDYADSITAERVRRVINGVPAARDKALQDGLGGSFTYCELGEPIEAESMLTGEALPTYSALAAYLIHTATGASVGQSALAPQNPDGLFYTFDETAFYMLYEPDLEWLCSNAGMLTAERADRIAAAVSASAAKRAIVFAPGKYIGQRDLTARRITFCQLPYEMRRAAGAL